MAKKKKGATFTDAAFLKTAADMGGLPPNDRPEIAFAGRSNVGKSSLINALAQKKQFARTSNTPGRTQHLNYFTNDDPFLYLVDMPGYGYAKAPLDIIQKWQLFLTNYLENRANLKRVLMLIDARRGFMKSDIIMRDLLTQCGVAYTIVMTKMDKLNKSEQEKIKDDITLADHPLAWPEIMFCSSAKNVGINALRRHIIDMTVGNTSA